jgi:hypothetical protein
MLLAYIKTKGEKGRKNNREELFLFYQFISFEYNQGS